MGSQNSRKRKTTTDKPGSTVRVTKLPGNTARAKFTLRWAGPRSPKVLALAIEFDNKLVGPVTATAIWDGVGRILAAVLSPKEAAELLRQMDIERKKLMERA